MLEVDGINVSYGSIRALWDVSFLVREGEIVTLLGSNGAGKLRKLTALRSPPDFSLLML